MAIPALYTVTLHFELPKPKNLKFFPSHKGPLGGADLHFNSPQPDTSRSCKSTDTGLVCRVDIWPLWTTVAFYLHSLDGDTSTVTLPPRFIVIRYSLGGDTDNSNTASFRTLWVHSTNPRRLCRSAWVGFLSPSVCLFVSLSVCLSAA